MSPNLPASVHQRLLNNARATERPFNEVLQRFALERFLYRVGHSPFSRRFVLKGAMMLTAWRVPSARPTRDIDLLGHMENSVDQVVSAVEAICQEDVPGDGLRFDAASIVGERIVEAADYSGVRVRFTAYLGNARIPMRIDVGFGDPLVPGPTLVRLPVILDFPPPEVQGYSRESAIAEKYHAMVTLGQLNSRMKDFYDIWSLTAHFAFEGAILAQAISKTFQSRGIPLSLHPTAFSDAFAQSREKQIQWEAFRRRLLRETTPATLREVVQVVASFLAPVTEALVAGLPFEQRWEPGSGWRPLD
ncbi:MAG TPA: nucleotidyl transferase AbiEii/AbiGii toxin family protein [Anaerolineae bacterium]|nr:nucleotidyl transferase AbiEii/AbiGii toxin family protein [Anaerolineae bacterium]